MSVYHVVVRTSRWLLESDPDFPETAPQGLLDPLGGDWDVPDFPPVAAPTTITVRLYDDGSSATWLPIDVGERIVVYVWLRFGDVDQVALVPFKGRVADVSATNRDAGGVIFTVVCADRNAELAATPAPKTVNTEPGIFDAYDIITDAITDPIRHIDTGGSPTGDHFAGINGTTFDGPGGVDVWDLTNVSGLDAINRLALLDVRGDVVDTSVGGSDGDWLARSYVVLAPYVDPSDDVDLVDLDGSYGWTLNEVPLYASFAGALGFHNDGGVWRLVGDAGYYVDGGDQLVLPAAAVQRDTGEWRKRRRDTVNTFEQSGTFESGIASGVFVDTIRRGHAEVVQEAGRVTRSISSPLQYQKDARDLGQSILGPAELIPNDYGLGPVTVAFEQLDYEAVTVWAQRLWPIGGREPRGALLLLTDVDDRWRLFNTPALLCRIMAAQLTMGKAQGRPAIRLQLTLQQVPIVATDGAGTITITELAAFPTDPLVSQLDHAITVDQLTLVGPNLI